MFVSTTWRVETYLSGTVVLLWALFGSFPIKGASAWAQSQKSAQSAPLTERNISATETVLDSVLASVNGKPITLFDVTSSLKPRRSLTVKQVVNDTEARQTLDRLIFERVLEAEAELRRIRVDPDELQSYIAEVAKRNEMSPEQFEVALKGQGIGLDDYKRQIRSEILKTRLASQLTQGGAGVSQEEIDRYIEQHPDLSKSGTKVKLRQIVVLASEHPDIEERVGVIKKILAEGTSFEKVAREYSDGPEAPEGGSLGVIALEDLTPALFDVAFPLSEGTVSEPIKVEEGYRLIMLERRYVDESASEKGATDERLRDEVRKTLENQKMEVKLNNFFTNDIAKHHTIDKKI